ncbi:phage tail protein [Aeromonas veronii]|uniref:Phage tail protein n=1 Tax=Aeromonas veronii TaxID=654 RepID=A0A3A9IDQ6_AERVE|nr:phage tail protein [Aeromonas veronii]RKJ83783.1 phage tail protein [Aeromonas veronii]RKJ84392.1 phage tail protein [Aeromonas veronii]RKJ89950.1 phage tail protein [Aeromonas veronii]RKJ92178.1 phage tail protein [Aeromonas veronii]
MTQTATELRPQGFFLAAMHQELVRVLPGRCARALDSWMEGGTIRLEPKNMGPTGQVVAWLNYTAVFSLENLPFRECRTETLIAVAASWVQEHDEYRDDFALPEPTYTVVPNDELTADLEIELQFCEPLHIVPDPTGPINWQGQTWSVAPFDVWVAEHITIHAGGGAHTAP